MTVPTKITLYDGELAVKEKSLSPFSIRVRLLLDYKKIPYEIEWIQFRDIEETAKAVGAQPTKTNADGTPGYTIPFITASFSDRPTIAISDSTKIAHFIERTYPDPEGKLFPPSTRVFQSMFTKYLTETVAGSLSKVLLPYIIRQFPESGQKWFIETRKAKIGKTIEELAPQDEASKAEAWRVIEGVFDDLAAHLDTIHEGNFRITGEPSYPEFQLVSVFNNVKLAHPDGWRRLEARNGGRWGKLMDLPLYKELLPADRV